MPSARYSALPASREDEMEAAFESDDDEPTRPMLPAHASAPSPTTAHRRSMSVSVGGYDFEQQHDYDRPPPGSPPSTALPNNYGNSNGLVPSGPAWRPEPNIVQRGLRALFPSRYTRVATSDGAAPVVGGGIGNDGVFANVTAKPTAARVERTPDGVYVMPEEAQKEFPPSYAAAQADAVPPYWETTVHAPSAAVAGEMMVDNLATGTLFSFLWNMLISLSFNFVGFLLTYLLHTSHAAKYGARAGLGVTLLQYGFALRNRDSDPLGTGVTADQWSWDNADAPAPTPSEANATAIAAAGNSTGAPAPDGSMEEGIAYPHEWIAFFLMTVGWFLVLTSFLGYWRVKRWEYQILANNAQQAAAAAAANGGAAAVPSAEQMARDRAVRRNLEQLFGFAVRTRRESVEAPGRAAHRRGDLEAQDGDADADVDDETNLTPEERRLRDDLRAAGLI